MYTIKWEIKEWEKKLCWHRLCLWLCRISSFSNVTTRTRFPNTAKATTCVARYRPPLTHLPTHKPVLHFYFSAFNSRPFRKSSCVPREQILTGRSRTPRHGVLRKPFLYPVKNGQLALRTEANPLRASFKPIENDATSSGRTFSRSVVHNLCSTRGARSAVNDGYKGVARLTHKGGAHLSLSLSLSLRLLCFCEPRTLWLEASR